MVLNSKAQLPEGLSYLFQPGRYKIGYGGRGGSKSWGYARALLVKASKQKLRILCCREIQNSIQESVHTLLKSQAEMIGLGSFYNVGERVITGQNGSEFLFYGLFRNVNKIKSLEGIDIVWVEEAESVSSDSWDTLIPTIRKDGSEIWVSFNPQYEDDETYKRFVANPPPNAIVRKLNYYDNPWFNDVLRQEMETDKARDPHKYEWLWLGQPKGSGRRVWPSFDKEIHVKAIPMEALVKSANCFMAMDPHSHYYPFCVWVAVIPKNNRKQWPEDFHRHVYAEWPTFEMLGDFYHEIRKKIFYKDSLADMAREILATDGPGLSIKARFMDTRYAKGAGSWNASTQTQGIVDLFAKRENGGLLFTLPEEKQIGAQREVIHGDMLWNRLQDRSEFNEPSFSVAPRCRNLIASLLNHRLEEDEEKEDEKYKDPSDALRICFAGFRNYGYEPPGEEEAEEEDYEVAEGRFSA